ncbi:MAG TPA: aminomethyl-transferring glycine dehydrogenase subunit GcvPA [Steroidobacteraceae bacterium]|jgi:glycine dehydrogenase subunit 1|nr:aminomethyl-transferring glycine dehydrogenase subunit GcvPA [Steroidobacteraceae bacterium]
MPFIPHTEDDVREMLQTIGAGSIEALFDEIPQNLRIRSLDEVPPGLSEPEVMRLMAERARRDGRARCFIGAGAYEHHIPAAVWSTVTRGEFYSAYTPYQAEASQGTLQTIYEYQSMMSSLTGMQVSNASLYDGATAVAEACLMAVRANRKSKSARILLPRSLHPHYRVVTIATASNQGLQFDELPFDRAGGQVNAASLGAFDGQDVTAVVIQQPNFFGVLEDVDALTDWAHAHAAMVIAVVNPTALAVLKPPGEWGTKGADIVVGDGQPFGCPLSSGGPYFGFMTTRMEYVRQMPGRIVGRTVDLDGRPGFTLTLQAREQHIRRAKATSNICTNQGLLMMAGTVYLSLMGAEGLERVAETSMARTDELQRALTALPGVRRIFTRPVFHEVALRLDRPVAPVLAALAERDIQGGIDLSVYYPELGQSMLVCATETKTQGDIQAYVTALGEVLRSAQAA